MVIWCTLFGDGFTILLVKVFKHLAAKFDESGVAV